MMHLVVLFQYTLEKNSFNQNWSPNRNKIYVYESFLVIDIEISAYMTMNYLWVFCCYLLPNLESNVNSHPNWMVTGVNKYCQTQFCISNVVLWEKTNISRRNWIEKFPVLCFMHRIPNKRTVLLENLYDIAFHTNSNLFQTLELFVDRIQVI